MEDIVQQKFDQTDKLSALLKQRPDLFEEFNFNNDIPWSELSESDLECLTEYSEVSWISTDDEDADRLRFYKFRWSDVEEFGIAPITPNPHVGGDPIKFLDASIQAHEADILEILENALWHLENHAEGESTLSTEELRCRLRSAIARIKG